MKSEEEEHRRALFMVSIVLGITLVALIGFYLMVGFDRVEITLPILLILGVMALIVTLNYTTTIFHSLGLSDSARSLGLPEGSMQAVIALSLILIFLISSLLLYEEVSDPYRIKTSSSVPQEALDKFPNDTIYYISIDRQINNVTYYRVGVKAEKTEASEDIAKQIITTVSTLVVAVAGFYFGSKAVSVAKGAVEAISDPLIRSIEYDENKGKRDVKISFTISGKNFESPAVKLIHPASSDIEGKDITSSSTVIKGTFTIPKDTEDKKYPGGEWTVVVINSDKGEDRLEGAFTNS